MTAVEFFNYCFLAIIALFPMVNPFSTIPLLLTLTRHEDEQERKRQATKACLFAGLIMMVTLFIGGLILEFFSISVASLRIAGGLIVAYIGFRMLFPTDETPTLEDHKKNKSDYALIPLALPSMSGAGTLATILTFSSQISEEKGFIISFLGYSIGMISIGVVVGLAVLILRAATKVNRLLGEKGIEAMARIMGLLLVCIGVQFIGNGVQEFTKSPENKTQHELHTGKMELAPENLTKDYTQRTVKNDPRENILFFSL